jgi:hypothetical protein
MDYFPASLSKRLDNALAAVTNRVSKFKKHYELKYRRKAGPRNIRLGAKCMSAFRGIEWDWPSSPSPEIQSEDVVNACDAVHLKPMYKGIRMFYFDPPKEQAGQGLFVDKETEEWYIGNKGYVWTIAFARAKSVLAKILDYGFTWRDAARFGRKIGDMISKELGLCLIPTWRLDGGADKLRMLLIGNIVIFIIENWFWQGLASALKSHPNFGYQPTLIKRFFEAGVPSGYKYLSGDFVAYDLHQQPTFLKAIYEGVSQLCELPESLAVCLWAYNCFTPALVVDDYGRLVVRMRNGQAASGIGGFAYANSVGCLTLNWKVSKVLRIPFVPGNYMGDDHVQPMRGSVLAWISAMGTVGGMEMSYNPADPDGSDTKVSPKEAIYCRRFFKAGSMDSSPVRMSRLRNAVFPEDGDVNANHGIRRAIVYRAQLEEIVLTASDDVISAFNKLAPQHHAMFNYTAEELAQQYSFYLESVGATEMGAPVEDLNKLFLNRSWMSKE